ncbi:MAG TPA: hypothetical protein VGA47_01835 [Candidatus Dormibacteraeota bacterium]
MSLAMHRGSAAAAQQDRSQRIGVLGPGLAGSPDVALLDFLASSQGLFIDQRGVEALDELAIDHDLAGVGRITDYVLENVASKDDRLHTVVVGFALTARRPDATAIQVLSQGAEAETTGSVEIKDLLDC